MLPALRASIWTLCVTHIVCYSCDSHHVNQLPSVKLGNRLSLVFLFGWKEWGTRRLQVKKPSTISCWMVQFFQYSSSQKAFFVLSFYNTFLAQFFFGSPSAASLAASSFSRSAEYETLPFDKRLTIAGKLAKRLVPQHLSNDLSNHQMDPRTSPWSLEIQLLSHFFFTCQTLEFERTFRVCVCVFQRALRLLLRPLSSHYSNGLFYRQLAQSPPAALWQNTVVVFFGQKKFCIFSASLLLLFFCCRSSTAVLLLLCWPPPLRLNAARFTDFQVFWFNQLLSLIELFV